MAHIGKFYKLQFRRDLALNYLNHHAFPEGALASSTSLGGTVGGGFAGKTFLLVNLLKDNQPPMVWSADNHVVNGVRLIIIFTIKEKPDRAPIPVELEIKRWSTGGTLFKAQGTSGPLGFDPPEYLLTFFPPFVQTPEISGSSGGVGWGMSAADWSAYNP